MYIVHLFHSDYLPYTCYMNDSSLGVNILLHAFYRLRGCNLNDERVSILAKGLEGCKSLYKLE